MKQGILEAVFALVLGLVVPWIFLGLVSAPSGEILQETTGETVGRKAVWLPVLADGQTVRMELTEYLTGVLLEELPADFQMEAKKAQAVVARTYALRTVQKGVKHDPAAVCTESDCCQGYRSVEDYLAAGGTQAAVEAAREAVIATQGLVLTYDAQLIDATYFSCSGGKTEAAVAVWGTDIPYLQSVESPSEEHAAHYTDTVSFTAEAFENALGRKLPGSPDTWFSDMTYTEGGGVESLCVCGKSYTGTQLRSLLGLRSTAFSVTTTATSVVITTKGFGHRVGMSQYGADAMAAGGSGYEEILTHYYTGAVIDKAEDLG